MSVERLIGVYRPLVVRTAIAALAAGDMALSFSPRVLRLDSLNWPFTSPCVVYLASLRADDAIT